MATRITKALMDDPFSFADGSPKEQVKMINNWMDIAFLRYYQGTDIIAPIIAKGNRFDGVTARE